MFCAMVIEVARKTMAENGRKWPKMGCRGYLVGNGFPRSILHSPTTYDYAPADRIHFLTTYTIDEWGIIHVIEKYKEKNKVLVDKMFRWKEPI